MPLMFVTFGVLKPERSSDVRLEQLSNMPLMFVTFDVSSFDKSSDVRLLQP